MTKEGNVLFVFKKNNKKKIAGESWVRSSAQCYWCHGLKDPAWSEHPYAVNVAIKGFKKKDYHVLLGVCIGQENVHLLKKQLVQDRDATVRSRVG